MHYPIIWLVLLVNLNSCECFIGTTSRYTTTNNNNARQRRKIRADTPTSFNHDKQKLRILERIHNIRRPSNHPKHDAVPLNDDNDTTTAESNNSNDNKSLPFSIAMALSGALLGPFLDSYHSSFGVLRYDEPFVLQLWSDDLNHPALITTWWVPPLFGLAGFIIGWMYILLDDVMEVEEEARSPSVPFVLSGIAVFTFQYWLSGVLFASSAVGTGDSLWGLDYGRGAIFLLMTLYAGVGFYTLDRTRSGLLTSLATAIGGPLIEVGLISTILPGIAGDGGGYHYMDGGETGFFPLWIVPVYFLGGPANGNLARLFWNVLDDSVTPTDVATGGGSTIVETTKRPCVECEDSRAVPCPNCDGQGSYVTYDQSVRCNCCRGSGRVICRTCFDRYGEDPADIERIRDFMARMPD